MCLSGSSGSRILTLQKKRSGSCLSALLLGARPGTYHSCRVTLDGGRFTRTGCSCTRVRAAAPCGPAGQATGCQLAQDATHACACQLLTASANIERAHSRAPHARSQDKDIGVPSETVMVNKQHHSTLTGMLTCTRLHAKIFAHRR